MKTGILLGVSTLLAAAFLLLPFGAELAVAEVTLTKPAVISAAEDLDVSGVVEQQYQSEWMSEIPLVIGEVYCEVGDPVKAGATVASVDVQATKEALLSLVEAASLIPEEYLAAFSDIRLDDSLLSAVIPDSITAPASGILLSSAMSPGTLLLPQQTGFCIGQNEALRVKLTVLEEEIRQVQEGDLVVFTANGTGKRLYGAIVTKIAPAAEQTVIGTSQRTTVAVYATLCTDTAGLKPGYTVTASVKDSDTADATALVVPYEAVLQDESGVEYVYLYEEGIAVRRDIISGTEYASGLAVMAGLSGEETIVENAAAVPGDGSAVLWRDAA